MYELKKVWDPTQCNLYYENQKACGMYTNLSRVIV